jgi:hypothetical protein
MRNSSYQADITILKMVRDVNVRVNVRLGSGTRFFLHNSTQFMLYSADKAHPMDSLTGSLSGGTECRARLNSGTVVAQRAPGF